MNIVFSIIYMIFTIDFSSGSLDSENENDRDNMDDNNIVADENNELFLFFLIYDVILRYISKKGCAIKKISNN